MQPTESSQSPTLSPVAGASLGRLLLGALAIVTVAICVLALTARSQLKDLHNLDPTQMRVLGTTLAAAILFWLLILFTWRRLLAEIGVPALAMLGMIAGLRFAITFGSLALGLVFNAVLGDFYSAFLRGIGDELLPSLLIAVAIVLRPRFGTATLLQLAHFLLNVIFSGTFGLLAIAYTSISIALLESLLAVLRVTTGPSLRTARSRPTAGIVVRLALAVGIAKGVSYYAQFVLFQLLLRMFYPAALVLVLCLVTGGCYAFLGAALGTSIGYRLRRVSQ